MATSNVQVGGFAGWAIGAIQRRREVTASRRSEKQLALVETLSLGGRRQVALVECDGQRFLVGMSAESVTSLVALRESKATGEGDAAMLLERREVGSRYARWEGGL